MAWRIAVLLLVAVLAFSYGAAAGCYALFPVPQLRLAKAWIAPGPNYAQERTRALEASNDHAAVVMLGDSTTQHGAWSELLPDVDVLNYGVTGDTVARVEARLDAVIRAKPRVVFLMVGVNDIKAGANPDDLKPAYHAIKNRLDAADILVVAQLTLLTRNADWNARVRTWNDHITRICRWPCRVVDLNPWLAPNGILEPTNDGLHLSPYGYQVWARIILPLARHYGSKIE